MIWYYNKKILIKDINDPYIYSYSLSKGDKNFLKLNQNNFIMILAEVLFGMALVF